MHARLNVCVCVCAFVCGSHVCAVRLDFIYPALIVCFSEEERGREGGRERERERARERESKREREREKR